MFCDFYVPEPQELCGVDRLIFILRSPFLISAIAGLYQHVADQLLPFLWDSSRPLGSARLYDSKGEPTFSDCSLWEGIRVATFVALISNIPRKLGV